MRHEKYRYHTIVNFVDASKRAFGEPSSLSIVPVTGFVKQTFLSVTAASAPLPDHRPNSTGKNACGVPESLRQQ